MNLFRVALCQLLPGKSLSENLEIGLNACKKAKGMGADLALFPEMWSCGYEIPQKKDCLAELAISINSPFMADFQQAAKSLQMAIGMTLLEQYDPAPRNTLRVFDRFGQDILTYAKVHTCDFGDEKVLTPGDGFYTADLDTGRGMVKIGAMICYDREFPESARILMLQGAEIILVPNACPMEINRISQLRARAFENMVGIATVNYPASKPDCNGHSTAFDGIVYRPDEQDSRDTLIAEAGEGECILLADFDLDELRTYRKTEVHGNAYRHPQKYKLLLSEEIQEPFVRDDYRNVKFCDSHNVEYARICDDNRQAVTDFIVRQWLSTEMILRGQICDMRAVDGIAAFQSGEIIGLVTWRPLSSDNALEILSLDSLQEGQGIGSLLVKMAVEFARSEGCKKILVITTNDNLHALGFYQKRGFELTQIYRNALAEARKIKPQIPDIGENGIPLRHEIELEYTI